MLLAVALALGPAWAGPMVPTAPSGRAPLRVYGTKDGLTSLNTGALAQDREGYLWVGTQSGLYRYDGVRFRKFGLEEGLPATNISALLVTADGSLWVGTTLRGLVRYRQGRFEPYGPGQGLPQSGFRGIAQGAGGHIWVATLDGLFLSTDGQHFSPAPGWPGGPATGLVAAKGGQRIWVTGQKAIHAMSTEGLHQSYGKEQGLTLSDTTVMEVDSTAALWVRTPQTLFSLVAGASRFTDHVGLLPPARTPAFCRDPSGALMVNSNQGLHVLQGDGTPRIVRFIKADSPYCAFVDQEGSLWIGTRPLSRVLGGGAFQIYSTADGFPSNLMLGIHRTPEGTLWVGTQSGACRATPLGWEVLPGTEGKSTRCIISTPDGDVWIGQRSGPPLRYTPRTGRLEAQGPASGFHAKGVFGMLVDRQGDLWLSQQGGGLSRGRKMGSKWQFESVALHVGIPDEDMFSIAQDSQGRILAAGTRGLTVLDHGKWHRYTRQDGLLDDALYQLVLLPDDRIVVAYREGLGVSILHIKDGRFEIAKHLDKNAGLVGNHVYMLGVDVAGRLWLGTGTGVSVLDGGRLDSLTTEDGLAGDDCDASSFLADADGGIWIGSNMGLSHFHPPTGPLRLPPLRSTVRELFSSGNPRPVDLTVCLDIPRDQNTLEFQISALTFLNESQVEHQVRLLGLEQDWQIAQGRSARYPALAPGFYTFQVRSRRKGGPWGPESVLPLQVLPAWWERLWVRALAWMLPLGLFAVAMRLRFQRLKRRNAELQMKVEEATGEIRSKAETLERVNLRLTQMNEDKSHLLGIVAHDLRNPLHTIQLHAELLGGEVDLRELDEGSREILRISREMEEMIRRLLDSSHVEAGELDLQMGSVDPRALVDSVVEPHFHRAATKDILLEVMADGNLPPVWADPFFLKEVLDNLISNAVKFTTPGPPTRVIRVVLKPGIIEVSDQGPGFTAQDQAQVFGRFNRLSAQPTAGESSTGLGLSIVKTILDAMGGQLELESTVGVGSTFRIHLREAP